MSRSTFNVLGAGKERNRRHGLSAPYRYEVATGMAGSFKSLSYFQKFTSVFTMCGILTAARDSLFSADGG